jgi:hypothetical protein
MILETCSMAEMITILMRRSKWDWPYQVCD